MSPNRLSTDPAPCEHAEAWDALEKFLHQLNQATDSARQLRTTLDAIRSATRADVVFLYTASARQVGEMAGVGEGLSAAALAVFAQVREGEGQALVERLPDGRSAALVRLSRSQSAWIVALRSGRLSARDLRLMSLARRMLQQQQRERDSQDQLKEVLFGLVRCLTATLDARDSYTRGHSERVGRMAARIGHEMRLTESACGDLYLGGLFHDIGKIGVPDQVLRKEGKLTVAEFDLIKQHVVIGDDIVAKVRQLAHLRPMVRSHHEQFNGSGYPDGLVGAEIPPAARIMAVADACDAMLSDRPYRRGLPPERVEAIFREGAGQQWDPVVVAALLTCKADVFGIGDRGLGESALLAVGRSLEQSGPDRARTASFA